MSYIKNNNPTVFGRGPRSFEVSRGESQKTMRTLYLKKYKNPIVYGRG